MTIQFCGSYGGKNRLNQHFLLMNKSWMFPFSSFCLETEIHCQNSLRMMVLLVNQTGVGENIFKYWFRIKFPQLASNYLGKKSSFNCLSSEKLWVTKKAESIMLSLLKGMQANGRRWKHQSALCNFLMANRCKKIGHLIEWLLAEAWLPFTLSRLVLQVLQLHNAPNASFLFL